VGTRIKFEGVVADKPVIKHLRSKKPLRIQVSRYFVNTHLDVSGVKVFYEGPAFLSKGERVTVWGTKKHDNLDAVKVETDNIVIQMY